MLDEFLELALLAQALVQFYRLLRFIEQAAFLLGI